MTKPDDRSDNERKRAYRAKERVIKRALEQGMTVVSRRAVVLQDADGRRYVWDDDWR